jgi:hypothetical protein
MGVPISVELSLDVPRRRFSVDEAVELIHRIHLQLESIEDYRLKLKWWMGFVLVHTEHRRRERQKTIDLIAERLDRERGIRARRSTLYQCLKLYEGLSGDYRRYRDWIRGRKMALGRPVFWYDVVEGLLGGPSNPNVIGREEADERDYRAAERAIEAIERIILRAAEGNEEAAGVLEGIRQSVIGLLLIARAPVSVPRSEEYLRYVATFGCLVCGRPSDAHHAVGRRGMGQKASDFGCVPLCRIHHMEVHNTGRPTFERRYDVCLVETAFNLLHRYVTGAWITLNLSRIDRPT